MHARRNFGRSAFQQIAFSVSIFRIESSGRKNMIMILSFTCRKTISEAITCKLSHCRFLPRPSPPKSRDNISSEAFKFLGVVLICEEVDFQGAGVKFGGGERSWRVKAYRGACWTTATQGVFWREVLSMALPSRADMALDWFRNMINWRKAAKFRFSQKEATFRKFKARKNALPDFKANI